MSKKYLKGTRIEDLRGMKFGKLTAIDFDWDRYEKDKIRKENGEIKNVGYYWMCKCECGKACVTAISSVNLKSGHTKTCGLCYTFEDWCEDNNLQDYLDLWDYELNECKPSEISFSSKKSMYFTCKIGLHDSELWAIDNLTSKRKNGNFHTIISCRKCNSIGHHLLGIYGNLDIWSDKNEEDPFSVTKMSREKRYLICPICGEINHMTVCNFVSRRIACSRCGDGFSIPSKMFKAVLDQLGIEYKMELTKSDFDWIGKYRYDFYIPSLNLIVEVNGCQHYKSGFNTKTGKTLEEEQENDRLKKELALQNRFNYCVIDCRYSELVWMRDNIIKEFGEYKDLSNINWTKAFEYTQSSFVKDVCVYWDNRKNIISSGDLVKIFGINKSSIIRYLKRGTDIGWCNYDAKEEMRKSGANSGAEHRKQVEVFKNGISIGVFKSVTELEMMSEELFGVKLYGSCISRVCNSKISHYKNFIFRYV